MKFAHSILYIFYFTLALYSFVVLSWTQLLFTYILFWFLLEFVMSMFTHRWATHDLWNPPVWFQNIMSVVSLTALIGTPYHIVHGTIIITKTQIQKKTHTVLNMSIGLELFLEHMNTKVVSS